MSAADKVSWLGGMLGLFTGFSVVSGFEIVYWLFFKILFHKTKPGVDPQKQKDLCDECEKRAEDEEENKTLRDKVSKQEARLEELEKGFTILKQMQMDGSRPGAFFDAIFKEKSSKEMNDL